MGSQALAGPKSHKKAAQPTQTPYHPLRTADIVKLLEREDHKGFMPIWGKTGKQSSSQEYIDGPALRTSLESSP